MGTFYTHGASKMDIVAELKSTYRERMVETCLKGNEFWAVISYEGSHYIALFLLDYNASGWGYKPMDEAMGPYYYGCPVKWLDRYPTTNAAALAWRETLRQRNRSN